MGEAYLLYVESGNFPENDIFTCALCDGGKIFHFVSIDCSLHQNLTYGITRKQTIEEAVRVREALTKRKNE